MKKQFNWPTVKINGVNDADVCVGMATAMVYEGKPIFLVAADTTDLTHFIEKVFGCNTKDFLMNHMAVLPADCLNLQTPLEECPQQGVLELKVAGVTKAYDDAVVVLKEVELKRGQAPFVMEQPAVPPVVPEIKLRPPGWDDEL